MTIDEKTILSATDYRRVLVDLIEESRKRNPRLSARSLATKAKVSAALVSRALARRCHLSSNSLNGILKALRVDSTRSAAVRLVFDLTVSSDKIQRRDARGRIRTRQVVLNTRTLDIAAKERPQDWIHLVLSVVAQNKARQIKDVDLASRFFTDVPSIEQGRIPAPIPPASAFHSDVRSAKLIRIHRESLRVAGEYSAHADTPERYMGTLSFWIDSRLQPQVNARTEAYLDDLITLARRSRRKDALIHSGAYALVLIPKTRTQNLK